MKNPTQKFSYRRCIFVYNLTLVKHSSDSNQLLNYIILKRNQIKTIYVLSQHIHNEWRQMILVTTVVNNYKICKHSKYLNNDKATLS